MVVWNPTSNKKSILQIWNWGSIVWIRWGRKLNNIHFYFFFRARLTNLSWYFAFVILFVIMVTLIARDIINFIHYIIIIVAIFPPFSLSGSLGQQAFPVLYQSPTPFIEIFPDHQNLNHSSSTSAWERAYDMIDSKMCFIKIAFHSFQIHNNLSSTSASDGVGGARQEGLKNAFDENCVYQKSCMKGRFYSYNNFVLKMCLIQNA